MVLHPVLQHVIVDGSNIATEGRDTPSLAQLDEAVQAFIREYEPELVTVVVDATFPNRIAKGERKTYEDAINAGEVITPPAGAIGRGDAFVLQIADRAGATVLSNDSFQEFHGTYDWLFDEGRLIGGKPVPHVGWVFMARTPVRGPTSRRSVTAARRAEATAAKTASPPRPEPSVAPSPRAPAATRAPAAAAPVPSPSSAPAPTPAPAPAPSPPAPSTSSPAASVAYNDALPFIDFVSEHPVGSEVDAVVEHFGSHGAYLRLRAVRAYVPLKNLADPAPRSAKEVLKVGESRRFVVSAIDPPRRGIDLALPGVLDLPKPPGAKRVRAKPKASAKEQDSPRKFAAEKAQDSTKPETPAAVSSARAGRSARKRADPAKQAPAEPAAAAAAVAATDGGPAKAQGARKARAAKKADGARKAAPGKAPAAKKADGAKKAAPRKVDAAKAPAETAAPAKGRKAAKAPAEKGAMEKKAARGRRRSGS